MARQKNKPKTSLAARLSEAREKTGLKRGQFADELGISKHGLGNYERGDRVPRATVLEAYAHVCNISLHWLITGEGDMFDDGAGRRAAPKAQNTEQDILQQAVKAVERGLAGAYIPPSKKAELIDLSCALLQTGKAEYLRKLISLLLTVK